MTRAPTPGDWKFLVRRSLAAQMRAQIQSNFRGGPGIDVVDVGCGPRPYDSLFAGIAKSYVGVDARPGRGVDVVASAEALPLEDRSFDCALSNQMLEHSDDPHAVVAEMWRILRPGGVALISTHGVAPYHANPDDYWRWTHAGLAKLVAGAGDWQDLQVQANGGVGTALAYVVGWESHEYARMLGIARPWRAVVAGLNLLGANFDRIDAYRLRGRMPVLAANYLVTATRR